MNTKLINQIQLKSFEVEYKKSKEDYDKSIDEEYKKTESSVRHEFEGRMKVLINELEQLIELGLIYMEGQNIVYDNEVVALFPDLKFYEGNTVSSYNSNITTINETALEFMGYTGDYMTLEECKKNQKEQLIDRHLERQAYIKNDKLLGGLNIKDFTLSSEPGFLNPIFRLNGVDSEKLTDCRDVLFLWLENNLIPKKFTKESKDFMVFLKEMQQQDLLTETCEINWVRFKENRVSKIKKSITQKSFADIITDKLLNCEKVRAAIDSYDSKILTDLNRGHWDLWEEADDGRGLTKLEKELVARDPRADIKEGGIVGIDFGTKSTVVVHQENREYTLPMRVGTGDFSKKTEQSQYENPTVIELKDLKSFMDKYKEKEGRPETKWEDVTVSHMAFHNLVNSSSEEYYAYVNDLKQWVDDRKRNMLLKDKKGSSIELRTFLELTEDDFNPIELYAYYLGLYINNMHNGIYMDYSLSFPVTYERDVRMRILESFKKGIKKSLPETLIKDEELMKNFRIYMGASEPAAYAICALEEYGFEPSGDEEVFYGIFDFGGGTTDFDFGIWKESDKPRKYDYSIEHFGAGGDRYLGGENLLELLAFNIFKDNEDVLREHKISFILPHECNKFLGSETLLSESQEAKLNTKQVMEKIRPLWEKHKNYEALYEEGMISVDLTDNMGNFLPEIELIIDIEKLETILKERIDKGVKNFFECLKASFKQLKDKNIDKINIFLAGNSSKSMFVKELFDDYILNNMEDEGESFFELFPALGTIEAFEKQKDMGLTKDYNDKSRPTGKTGVAFGLIESRKGGKIDVIDGNVGNDEEIKFKYFIGMNRRKKFQVIIDRDVPYNQWIEFADAIEEDFEIYYTELPEAATCDMDIQKVERKKCKISEVNENAFVYIRRTGPTVIEYAVAFKEGIKQDIYISELVSIDLS